MTREEIFRDGLYRHIYSLIGKGKDRAIPAKEICQSTGLSDRSLRKAIETMRKSGICIISDAYGYFRPSTEQELESYIKRMEKTARSYFYILRTAKRELRRMKQDEQIRILLEDD